MSSLVSSSSVFSGSSAEADPHLSCPLCKSPFTTSDSSAHLPLILPCCGQSLCSLCFSQFRSARCPFDQAQLAISASSGPDQPNSLKLQPLVRNRALIDLIQRFSSHSAASGSAPLPALPSLCSNDCPSPAAIFCSACGHDFCSKCDEALHTPKPFRNHVRIPIAEKPAASVSSRPPELCSQHPGNPLLLFCQQCQEPACSICILLKHQNHVQKLVSLSENRQLEEVRLASEAAEEEARMRALVEAEKERETLKTELTELEKRRADELAKIELGRTELNSRLALLGKEAEQLNARTGIERRNIERQIEEKTRKIEAILRQSAELGKGKGKKRPRSDAAEMVEESPAAVSGRKRAGEELEIDAEASSPSAIIPQMNAASSSSVARVVQGDAAREKKFDAENAQLFATFKGHYLPVNSVCFSPDGNMLASGSDDRNICLWRSSDWTLIRTLMGHSSHIRSVCFSPDRKLLASGAGDRSIRIWNVEDGECIQTLQPDDAVLSVCFSPDGTLLAAGSRDKRIRLWQISDWALLKTLDGHSLSVRSIRFSPDGSIIASGSEDHDVRLWRVQDWRCINVLRKHTGTVYSVCFSPDGQLLASGSEDKTIQLWRMSDWSLLRTLKGHTSEVNSVAFSPDGSMLASGSDDKSIRLWNMKGGKSIILKGHSEWINSVCFSSNGSTIASGSFDRTVRIWK